MPMTATLSFGALLKQLRKRVGMSQRDLAAALNYSDSLISSLENAQRQPNLDTVIHNFIPALGLQDDPITAALLIERAAVARGERPPHPATLYHLTYAGTQEEQAACPRPLPRPPNELIGRDEEVHRLCNRLLGHHGRLLTLVGPPGIGKTRLALAVATRLQRHYSDGALFVPLAAIADPITMASTIAAAVSDSQASVKPPHVRLIEVLRHKHMVLVLDNCEQIAGAAPLIAEVVAACPRLTLLATSRERLHLRAEQRYPVPALELAAAVELFVQRAAALDMDFTTTVENRPTLEAICQRLDRLPLALELCAAQVDVFALAQILQQLRARPLDLLVDGAHDLPPQHRALRQAIQRSYELLPAYEQVLFRRLGVFVGGCSLAALEAVCLGEQDAKSQGCVSTLHALIGKSLVHAETTLSDERRFLLLETIREYARERLVEVGELERMQERHFTYYLALVEQAEPHLRGPQQAMWLACLEGEHANLRSALAWALVNGTQEMAMRLAGALALFWYMHGHVQEGYQHLQRVLAQSDATLPYLRAKVLGCTGAFAKHSGDLQWVADLCTESLRLYQVVGDKPGIAHQLKMLGSLNLEQAHYGQAHALMEQALAVLRALDDKPGIAECLDMLGYALKMEGDFEQAQTFHEASLAMRRELNDTYGIAFCLNSLGHVLLEQGRYSQAVASYEKSLTLRRNLYDQRGIARSLGNLGVALGAVGAYERAIGLLEESLAFAQQHDDERNVASSQLQLAYIFLDQGQKPREATPLLRASLAWWTKGGERDRIASCLDGLGGVAAWQGQPERAVKLWGAGSLLRDSMGVPASQFDQLRLQKAMNLVRDQLGETGFAAAWEEGRGLTVEQAIARAKDDEAG